MVETERKYSGIKQRGGDPLIYLRTSWSQIQNGVHNSTAHFPTARSLTLNRLVNFSLLPVFLKDEDDDTVSPTWGLSKQHKQ